ncbi:glycosyltransferase family 2 protein [Sphingobium lignivorans]|uniref:Glycosyltransferase 2-like domain-containing protein n=1 Tax=Sphingobium lignivorans TaxID=2735886 RepID=A0ABR6NKE6_9SPHN|nr:glycosyltransferase [Sphingobium lignivorans]MBB5987750.1 hypothetical protein [Sphingobium lignivorans]
MAISPFVTVIICTRNRAESLARTLDSLVTAAARMSESWELLVVDNGSTDATPEVIERFAGRLPIRRVWQPVAGLSNARNAGVAESKGDYVLWTDDDVLVDENWLAAWSRAFRERPGDAVFGGRTEPVFEEPREPWFTENRKVLRGLLAIRDRPEWTEVTPSRLPWGLNYAVRGAEQRAQPYDPELGVAPGRRRGGEEVAVIKAILAQGGTGSWVWDATVLHIIPAERQTESYIRTFYEAVGFDNPIRGVRTGLPARARAVLSTLRVLAESGLAYRRTRKHDRREAVQWLVLNARASGSLRRHLGYRSI